MTTTHDCTCQLEHAMPNLARYARDAESARAREHAEGKLNEHEEAEVGKTHEEREKMPAGAFLEPGARKYPVKEHRNGEWVYTRQLLLAAARRARLEGDHSLAAKADTIRNREFGEEDHVTRDLNTLMPNIMAARGRTGDAPDYTKMNNNELKELRARALTRGSKDPVAEAIRAEMDRRARTTTTTFQRRTGKDHHALDCMPNLKAIRDARDSRSRV